MAKASGKGGFGKAHGVVSENLEFYFSLLTWQGCNPLEKEWTPLGKIKLTAVVGVWAVPWSRNNLTCLQTEMQQPSRTVPVPTVPVPGSACLRVNKVLFPAELSLCSFHRSRYPGEESLTKSLSMERVGGMTTAASVLPFLWFYPVWFYPVWFYYILFGSILFASIIFCLVLPCLVLSCLILFCLVLSCLVPFCFTLHTGAITCPEPLASAMPLDTRPIFSQVHCNHHLAKWIFSKFPLHVRLCCSV